MTLDNGYRMTARHDGKVLDIAWRPFANGGAPSKDIAAFGSTVIVTGKEDKLSPIPGSQAAFLQTRADIAVVLDTRDENLLFDQLSAIRVMLANADFSRQTWHFYDAAAPSMTLAKIEADAGLATGWAALRALLADTANPAEIGPLAQIIQQLAAATGDRKALVLPYSLMPALKPGLTPQGIAGLQAFGISLYPMIGALPPQTRAAYKTLAGATGGHLLPWLIVPPNAAGTKAAFAPLMAGGVARYTLPKPPWQPWKTPPPLQVVLSDGGTAKLRMDIPLPIGAWSDLPWALIAGLAALFVICAGVALIWLRRQNSIPLRAQLTEAGTGRHYDIIRWPATLGRGDDADITIANAHLAPIQLRFSDNGTGVDIRCVPEDATLRMDGKEKRDLSLYRDGAFETAGVSFHLKFLKPV